MWCRVRGTFLEDTNQPESQADCRSRSWDAADCRMQSGHCEWVEFTLDLRKEQLAVGKKLAERRPVDCHSPPLGAAYVCDHSKKVCSFCRDWLLGSQKKCTGHPEDKCGKASCCVSHYNYRETRKTMGSGEK
mmetsp:Transcript_54538/g.145642  ORF Transcript_54538/g.145642 Transcript_54538/m.145642 type:complete len:132 (+) Transcript_54538:79-474(+)